jgi:hypothetical protein
LRRIETISPASRVICDYCKTPGTNFVAIIQDSESKVICRPCIKGGKATPAKPKPHVRTETPSKQPATTVYPQHDLDARHLGRRPIGR